MIGLTGGAEQIDTEDFKRAAGSFIRVRRVTSDEGAPLVFHRSRYLQELSDPPASGNDDQCHQEAAHG